MHHLISLRPNSFQRGVPFLITILLLGGAVAAQDRKAQAETAKRLIIEGTQLVTDGSRTSLETALEKFESARTLLNSLGFNEGEGAMLSMLGLIYSRLDQYQKAIEKYEQSLVFFRAAGEKKGEATALVYLGLIHSTLGEIEKALDHFLQALLLFRAAGERQGEALTLATIANLHISLGKAEESLTLFTKALERVRATGHREGEALVLTALSSLYNRAGQPQKARETMEQALSVSRAAGYRQGEALALVTLGFTYTAQLDLQKALETYEQALPLFRAVHDRVGESLTLHGLCASYISSRNYEKGFDYCAQSQALLRSMGHRQTEAMTLKLIAIGERNRGNLAASQTAIESAIAIVESVRTKVVNPEFRLSYLAGSQDYYEVYIDLLMLWHKQHPNDGYDGKALEATERARARSLLETLNEANADIRQGIDAVLLQREREIQRRLNARAQTQMRLLSTPHLAPQATAIAEEIESLIKELQQVETEIRRTSPHYAALMQPRSLTLKEIQTQLLDPDTLLLEYSLGEDRSYVWAVTSSSITSHELPKRSEIDTAARRFYDLLNARNTRVKGETNAQRVVRVEQSDAQIPDAAASLSRMVLAPVA